MYVINNLVTVPKGALSDISRMVSRVCCVRLAVLFVGINRLAPDALVVIGDRCVSMNALWIVTCVQCLDSAFMVSVCKSNNQTDCL